VEADEAIPGARWEGIVAEPKMRTPFAAPASLQLVDPEAARRHKFCRLVEEWKAARGAISSITAMSTLPAYQKIIGMGEPAILLILEQLKSEGDEPDQWFWVLKALTDDDPVDQADRGDYVAMARAWIQWGELVHAG
jgi:hypothetical protein